MILLDKLPMVPVKRTITLSFRFEYLSMDRMLKNQTFNNKTQLGNRRKSGMILITVIGETQYSEWQKETISFID